MLVFIHGWSCDRTYWSGQLEPCSRTHRVVVLDLAGHGESGRDRSAWSIPSFGNDVTAGASVDAGGARAQVGDVALVLDERFRGLLGRAPMAYLTAWRLRLVARELRTTDAPLAEIAGAVGMARSSPGEWRSR